MVTVGPLPLDKGFTGGYGFSKLPSGYLSVMRNARIDQGAFVSRWGQFILNDATLGTSKQVTGLTAWHDTVNSKDALVAVCNGKLWIADLTSYFDNGTQKTFTDRTGALTLSSTTLVRYTFDSLNNMLIGVGNSAAGGVPFKVTAYNANGAALGGTPPNGDAVKMVNNFLFIGRQIGSTTTQSRVSWSNVADPETWTAGNFIEFNKNDGEAVTALGSIGPDLYIFKNTSIGRLSTMSQIISGAAALGPLQTIIKGIGCCGPLAVDNLPNGNLIFLGSDGHVYVFDGSSVLDISKIAPPGPNVYDFGDYVTYGLSTGAPNAFAALKVWRGLNEVWVSFDSTNGGPAAWIFDLNTNTWGGWLDASANPALPKCFATLPGAGIGGFSNSSSYLFNGNEVGNIVQQNYRVKRYATGQDGSADRAEISLSIRLGKDSVDFIPRSVCFEVDRTTTNSTIAFYYAFDTPDFSTVLQSSWSSVGIVDPFRIIVPITYKQDSSTANTFPVTMTMWWQIIGAGSGGDYIGRINNIYLSDEVIR